MKFDIFIHFVYHLILSPTTPDMRKIIQKKEKGTDVETVAHFIARLGQVTEPNTQSCML